jgi:hypothetical protein
MGLFGEATGGILKSPKHVQVMSVRTGIVWTSTGQLDTVLRQVEDVTLVAKRLVAGHSQSDLTTSLKSTAWSVAQCLDHLAQTTNAFVPAISTVIARAPRLATTRALATGAFTQLFIRNLEPPYRLRFTVPAGLVPRQSDFKCAWGAFEDSQAQLAKTLGWSAASFAIDQLRIKSPVYGLLSYNVCGALRMLTAHQRRHLWQIDQLLKALDGAEIRNASNFK